MLPRVLLPSGLAQRHGQQGQALVEWMIVATLAIMTAVWAASEFAHKAEQAAVQGYAHWLQSVAGAVSDALKHEDASTYPTAGVFGPMQMGVLAPVEPWLGRLKQGGWLSGALAVKPKMPYEVKLVRLNTTGSCDDGKCPVSVLVLAIPRPGSQPVHPSAMFEALDGQGLAVTDLAPDRLKGASYQLPNPLAQGLDLPVGTVGLLAWRSDRPPPYVRLHESRRVTLAAGAQLGRLATADGSCHPDGLVMVGPDGKLRVCRQGRWDSVSQEHDHVRACLPQPHLNSVVYALFRSSALWSVFGREPDCNCPAGFTPFALGTGGDGVGAVELMNGRACLRL